MVESIECLSLIIAPFLADVGKSHLEIAVSRCGAIFARIAASCSATASDTADRLVALDDLLTKGVGVVADLRKDLGRRDAEVVLLHGQIVADRALIADGPATSGLGMR